MTAQTVFALALLAAALWLHRVCDRRARGTLRVRGVAPATLDHALEQRMKRAAAVEAASNEGTSAQDEQKPRDATRSRFVKLIDSLGQGSLRWLDMPIRDEGLSRRKDRRLLERCGFSGARARARFFLARITGAVLLPLVVLVSMSGQPQGGRFLLFIFGALTFGFMSPKWVLSRMAGRRQRAVNSELPVFVDLLRLLQGVGLSLDQSLQVMINDFSSALPVLSKELAHRAPPVHHRADEGAVAAPVVDVLRKRRLERRHAPDHSRSINTAARCRNRSSNLATACCESRGVRSCAKRLAR